MNLLDSLISNFTGLSEHSGIPTKKISGDNSSTAGSRSRYAALRDRRAKVARSKSTAVVGFMGYNNDEGNLLSGIDNCLGKSDFENLFKIPFNPFCLGCGLICGTRP